MFRVLCSLGVLLAGSVLIALLSRSRPPRCDSEASTARKATWRFASPSRPSPFAALSGSPRFVYGTGVSFDGQNDVLRAPSPLQEARDFTITLRFRPERFAPEQFPRPCTPKTCRRPDTPGTMQKVFTLWHPSTTRDVLMFDVALAREQLTWVSWVWLRSGGLDRHYWARPGAIWDGARRLHGDPFRDEPFPGPEAMFQQPVDRWYDVQLVLRDFELSLFVDGQLQVRQPAPYLNRTRTAGYVNVGANINGAQVFRGTIQEMSFTTHASCAAARLNSTVRPPAVPVPSRRKPSRLRPRRGKSSRTSMHRVQYILRTTHGNSHFAGVRVCLCIH